MGKIKVTNCDDIEGLKVIEPTVFGDSRGYFMETYNYNDFKEAGIDVEAHVMVFFAVSISSFIIHRTNLSA